MPIKHHIDCSEELWKNVLRYKLENDLKNNNEALIGLIEKGLKEGENDGRRRKTGSNQPGKSK